VNPTLTDDITTVPEENGYVDVYNLMGIKVRSQVKANEALNGLPSGMYIVGNKKVFKTNHY
jgi:hypothetical protein